MLFNSYVFIFLLLPLTLFLFFYFNRFSNKIALSILLVSSAIFYGYNSIINLCFLFLSIVINFIFSKFMVKNNTYKKYLLVFGIFCNLGFLFFFKYGFFVLENVNIVFGSEIGKAWPNLALPLGISFYTFQQIAYLVDIYRNQNQKYSFLEYANFIAFFAQLVAGPIAYHSEIIPKMKEQRKKVDWEWMADGIYVFGIGLAKKVLVADNLAPIVNYGYSNIASLTSLDAWIVMLSYTLQIYFDFSGYCDMACGIGKMFHIELPINFDKPYKSCSITEFWSRWHITLNRFFREYVYIPLGGNRKGKFIQYKNILIVFLLSGIWHGANWTFILWGCLHGVLNVFSRSLVSIRKRIPKALTWLGTFLCINILWVLFRADSISQAMEMYQHIFSFSTIKISEGIYTKVYIPGTRRIAVVILNVLHLNIDAIACASVLTLFLILLGTVVLATLVPNVNHRQKSFSIRNMIFICIIFVVSILSFSGVSEFLYFNF